MIDSIEHNVSQAVDYVEDAAENVNIAEQYYKQAVKVKIFYFNIKFNQSVFVFLIEQNLYFNYSNSKCDYDAYYYTYCLFCTKEN
jgi:t-SNARE complex subunit (syntaxin)